MCKKTWAFEYKGDMVPITNMFDINGNETDDPLQAHTFVAKVADDKWLACEAYPDEIKEYYLT